MAGSTYLPRAGDGRNLPLVDYVNVGLGKGGQCAASDVLPSVLLGLCAGHDEVHQALQALIHKVRS